MKKLFLLILTILGIFLAFFEAKAEDTDRYFIVTAYYSPLPNQEYYMMGDLESEKILQGNGTHGASGKGVFSGMFAAPKTYSFGTKIYIEGIGVGEVADRGGAIVQAGKKGHKYDRIDIWMGYGDEGLKRALAWGKRTVKGKIVSPDRQVNFDYKKRAAPDWAVNGLKSQKEKTIFDYNIGKKSSPEKVKKLQTFLKEIGIYKGEINGVYDGEVMDIIFDLQLANSIINSEKDYGAGYFGPKTRAAFKKMYLNGDIKIESTQVTETKKVVLENKKVEKEEFSLEEKTILDLENKKDKNVFKNFRKTKEEIVESLEIMKELGIYSGKTDLDYKKFIDIVYDFQVKNEIVKTEFDAGAGYFGPKTRAKLKEKYIKYIDEMIVVEKEKQAEEKRKKELEEKYEKIELYAKKQTKKQTKNIGILKKGDVSVKVRNLQNTLKELGYFDYKDTAIFGDITKKAVADFQVKYKLVESHKSEYAGIMGERTLAKLGEVLYDKYYNEKLESEDLEAETLVAGL